MENQTNNNTININDPAELEFWAGQLNVETSDITSAVEVVGNSIEAVRQHLAG